MSWENYGANKVWSFSSLNRWKTLDLSNPDIFYSAVRFDSFVPILNSEFGGSLRNLMGGKVVPPEKPILGMIRPEFNRSGRVTHNQCDDTNFEPDTNED